MDAKVLCLPPSSFLCPQGPTFSFGPGPLSPLKSPKSARGSDDGSKRPASPHSLFGPMRDLPGVSRLLLPHTDPWQEAQLCLQETNKAGPKKNDGRKLLLLLVRKEKHGIHKSVLIRDGRTGPPGAVGRKGVQALSTRSGFGVGGAAAHLFPVLGAGKNGHF